METKRGEPCPTATVLTKERALFEAASDSEFAFRRLEYADFDKGFLEVLKGLTVVGDTSKQQFLQRFN